MSTFKLEQLAEQLKMLPASPETDEEITARAAVMQEYLTLEGAMRNTPAAPPEKLIAVRPPKGIDQVETMTRLRTVEMDYNNRPVIRMGWEEFCLLVMLSDNGRDWARNNVEHMRRVVSHIVGGIN